MWISFKLFLIGFIKRFYFWIPTIFLEPIDLYNQYIKQLLPNGYQYDIKIPAKLGLILFILMIVGAVTSTYHELRTTRLNDFYKFSPEATKDKIFRIFYELYKEGTFLRDANTERRQKWDEIVLLKMKDHCKIEFKNLYLLNTGRENYVITPLEDKDYDKALDQIKDFIDRDFDIFVEEKV